MARKRFQHGSLFQRGTRQRIWVARWYEDVIRPDGTIGRMRRAGVLGAVADLPTRRAAMRVLEERLRTINSSHYRPQCTRKFEDFVRQDWMPVVLPTLKYATQKHYHYLLHVHLLPAFGLEQLNDVSRERIQAFLTAKLTSGLSWETVHHLKCGLSKILGTAEEWGLITNNPARKAMLPRHQPSYVRNILTPNQIRQLVGQLSEPARSITLLLLFTGMRIGELLALRWRNVDLRNRLIHVAETVYDGIFDQPKTKRGVRSIPVGSLSAAVLTALRPTQADGGKLVFSTPEGGPLDRWNLLRKHLKPAAKRAGIGHITWHSLRHCHATMLDAVGASLGTVQALLGHASPEVTRQVYLHAIPDVERRAVKRVEKLVFGPKRTQVSLKARRIGSLTH